MSTIEEYFLLASARADAARIPEDARLELGRILDLGRQRASAAEALWSNGHSAEGFRMITDAFEITLTAVPRFANAIGAELTGRNEDDLPPLLGARGLPTDRVQRLLEIQASIPEATLPALDADLTSEHADLFGALVESRRDVELALAPVAMTPATLASVRTWRLVFAVLVLVVAAAGAFVALRTPDGIEADASAVYGPDSPASNVIDGDPASEWQLPDGQEGWVEVRITPPGRVETLRLLNSHNRHHNDRASRRYRVDVFAHGNVVHTIESEWEEFEVRPSWVEHAVGVADVERIRVEVLSHHRLGGGLAEMEWR